MPVRTSTNIHTWKGTMWPYESQMSYPYSISFTDTFEQATVSHPKYSYQGDGDGGGPWLMQSVKYQVEPAMVDRYPMRGPAMWYGPIGYVPVVDTTPVSESDLRGMGTKAIALTMPTNPSFDAAQFLGELREGLPRSIGSGLLKEKTRFLKGSGSEYLNVEFGWKPLINDLKNLGHAVKQGNKIIESYRKGSSKKIRRRFNYPPSQTTSRVSGFGFCRPVDDTGGFGADGSVIHRSKSESWFSGAFKYYVPVGDDVLDKLKRHENEANKLFGVRLTPELVWNLSPWTWAADWFANTGDILHNISHLGRDGLLMQYGYMMDSTTNEDIHDFVAGYYSGSYSGTWRTSAGSYYRKHTVKRRIPASPFGFDLSFDGLSDRQLAIAAAVGITRR